MLHWKKRTLTINRDQPMRIQTTQCVSLILLSVGLVSLALADSPLRIRATDDSPEGFTRVFTKQIDVFGLAVYATAKVPDEKLRHAAGVLAQYLDNDGDGIPDNPRVIAALRKSKGIVFMFDSEQAFEKIDIHRHIRPRVWNEMMAIGLFAEETLPGAAARGEFDATLEEVLHLVTSGGYSMAYPEVFGERPGTAIAKAMDKARGGHFRRVPRKYPKDAWYSYDDRSCDYACHITEYFYWGLTSMLGAQDYPGRGEEISKEWKLNTAEKLEKGDPTLFRLLTDPKYRFPKRLPDGKYKVRIGDHTPQQILSMIGAKGRDAVAGRQLAVYRRIFGFIDANGDGQHSRKEFVDDGRYLTPQARQGIFRASDSNGDGIVSEAEYIENRIITDEAKAIFDEMDADGDGKLARKEFVASGKLKDEDLAKAVFEALDSNDNGELVVPEFLRVWGRWARSGRKTHDAVNK